MYIHIEKKPSLAPKLKQHLKQGNIIILYYMNGCPACEDFKPTWEDFVKKNQSKYHMGAIERSFLENDFRDYRHHVEYFPSIMFYKSLQPTSSKSMSLSKKPILENLFNKHIPNYTHQNNSSQHDNINNNYDKFEGDRNKMSELINFVKERYNTHTTPSSTSKNKKTKKKSNKSKSKKSKKSNGNNTNAFHTSNKVSSTKNMKNYKNSIKNTIKNMAQSRKKNASVAKELETRLSKEFSI